MHDHPHPEFELICFFCGRDAGHEHIMLGAFWDHGSAVAQEHWPAHAECLLEHMSPAIRASGGPFLDAQGPAAQPHAHDGHAHG